VVGGGLSQGTNVANGNTVSFSAAGSSFLNNNGFNNFDHGGLVIIGGENTSFPNGTSNNNVSVSLAGCRFSNNQLYDLAGIGARSNPETIGPPGTNNHVIITRRGASVSRLVQFFVNCIPDLPELMNTVTVNGR
jgi:hypothetical protein